jgi:DNA-binding PadR family transcriptional regulator
MKRQTQFDFDILTLLGNRQLYGLQIQQAFEDVLGRTLKSGSLYPKLSALENQGLIEGERNQLKVLYRLTDLGHRVLEEEKLIRQKLAFWGVEVDFHKKNK